MSNDEEIMGMEDYMDLLQLAGSQGAMPTNPVSDV